MLLVEKSKSDDTLPPNPDTRPLPDGWRQDYDREKQSWFYLHIKTSQRSYIHPQGPNIYSPPPTDTDGFFEPGFSSTHPNGIRQSSPPYTESKTLPPTPGGSAEHVNGYIPGSSPNSGSSLSPNLTPLQTEGAMASMVIRSSTSEILSPSPLYTAEALPAQSTINTMNGPSFARSPSQPQAQMPPQQSVPLTFAQQLYANAMAQKPASRFPEQPAAPAVGGGAAADPPLYRTLSTARPEPSLSSQEKNGDPFTQFSLQNGGPSPGYPSSSQFASTSSSPQRPHVPSPPQELPSLPPLGPLALSSMASNDSIPTRRTISMLRPASSSPSLHRQAQTASVYSQSDNVAPSSLYSTSVAQADPSTFTRSQSRPSLASSRAGSSSVYGSISGLSHQKSFSTVEYSSGNPFQSSSANDGNGIMAPHINSSFQSPQTPFAELDGGLSSNSTLQVSSSAGEKFTSSVDGKGEGLPSVPEQGRSLSLPEKHATVLYDLLKKEKKLSLIGGSGKDATKVFHNSLREGMVTDSIDYAGVRAILMGKAEEAEGAAGKRGLRDREREKIEMWREMAGTLGRLEVAKRSEKEGSHFSGRSTSEAARPMLSSPVPPLPGHPPSPPMILGSTPSQGAKTFSKDDASTLTDFIKKERRLSLLGDAVPSEAKDLQKKFTNSLIEGRRLDGADYTRICKLVREKIAILEPEGGKAKSRDTKRAEKWKEMVERLERICPPPVSVSPNGGANGTAGPQTTLLMNPSSFSAYTASPPDNEPLRGAVFSEAEADSLCDILKREKKVSFIGGEGGRAKEKEALDHFRASLVEGRVLTTGIDYTGLCEFMRAKIPPPNEKGKWKNSHDEKKAQLRREWVGKLVTLDMAKKGNELRTGGVLGRASPGLGYETVGGVPLLPQPQ